MRKRENGTAIGICFDFYPPPAPSKEGKEVKSKLIGDFAP